MRVSRSRLRKIIAEELSTDLYERKSRVSGQVAGSEAGSRGAITADVFNEAELKAIGQDRVKADQSITLSQDRDPDIDFFGLADMDEMHEFVTELFGGNVIGSQGSATFTPWQAWGSAGKGTEENKIHWTLWNNVSGQDAAPDSRGFIVVPNTIGLKTQSQVEEEQEAEAAAQASEKSDSAESDYLAGIQTMIDAADRVGTEVPDFDQGLRAAIGAWKRGDDLDATDDWEYQGDYVSADDIGYDDVIDMITGEFSGSDEDDREDAWNDNDASKIEESKSDLTPLEIWAWTRSENLLREQDEAEELEPTTEEIQDPANTSSPGMEMYIERVEELLQSYPRIGWGLRDDVELPTAGTKRIPPVAYFFSKSSEEDSEALYRAGRIALEKVAGARKRDSPEDRETLAAIETGAVQTRTGEAPEESEEDPGEADTSEETVSESLARSIIRQQLLIERS